MATTTKAIDIINERWVDPLFVSLRHYDYVEMLDTYKEESMKSYIRSAAEFLSYCSDNPLSGQSEDSDNSDSGHLSQYHPPNSFSQALRSLPSKRHSAKSGRYEY